MKSDPSTVYFNTGLTPCQLAEQREELLEALQDILLEMAANQSNGLTVKQARRWASVERARAVIAKAKGQRRK